MIWFIIRLFLRPLGIQVHDNNADEESSEGGTFTSIPDTPSPVFPERLIRPLPKRPLRARLSQEAQDSILYPPAPESSSPIFYSPYNENGILNDAKVHVQQNLSDFDPHYTHERDVYEEELDMDSGDDEGHMLVRGHRIRNWN